MKYLKVMYGNKGANFEYKIGEVNEATIWNPSAKSGRDFGGFNYTTEDCILRWLHRGDTLYDVEIPKDADVVKLEGATTIYRSNKIIITNPRPMTDELALEFYEKSNIPEKSYFKALGAVAIMNYKNTALQILRDKVNNDNIDEVLEEWNDFINHGDKNDRKELNALVKEIDELLNEIKSDLLISRFIDKEPYVKNITKDKIINITGESGSGKSYFINRYINGNNYIIIDTDVVFSNRPSDNKESIELRSIFSDKPKDYLITNFDDFYIKVLDHFQKINKTVIIDSAQYRNIKDYSILRGKMIVMRTSIETCYERVLNRWKLTMKDNYTGEEYQKYSNKKIGMFRWYKSLNKFLQEVDKIC